VGELERPKSDEKLSCYLPVRNSVWLLNIVTAIDRTLFPLWADAELSLKRWSVLPYVPLGGEDEEPFSVENSAEYEFTDKP